MRRAYSIPASALRNVSEWNSVLATSSGLGFDTLLISLSRQNVFADLVCGDLDIARLVALARDRSLQIILDVPISSVPAMSPAARMLDLSESGMGARDPRIAPAERQNLPISFSDEAKARTWIDILRKRLLELQELGIAGFCCRLKPDMPEWIFPLLAGGGQSEAANTRIPLWVSLARLDDVPKFESIVFAGAFLPAISLFETRTLARVAEASRFFGEMIFSADEPLAGRRKFQDRDQAVIEKRSKFLLWASAALGDGILVPMGFEYGLVAARLRSTLQRAGSISAGDRPFDLSEDIAAANAFVGRDSGQSKPTAVWPAAAGKVLAAVRRSGDKTGIRVVLANPDMDRDISLPASSVSREVGEFLPLKDTLRSGPSLAPDENVDAASRRSSHS